MSFDTAPGTRGGRLPKGWVFRQLNNLMARRVRRGLPPGNERLLSSLSPEQWKRTFRHPDLGSMTLEKTLALYAWHGQHHVAHITELRKRMGW